MIVPFALDGMLVELDLSPLPSSLEQVVLVADPNVLSRGTAARVGRLLDAHTRRARREVGWRLARYRGHRRAGVVWCGPVFVESALYRALLGACPASERRGLRAVSLGACAVGEAHGEPVLVRAA